MRDITDSVATFREAARHLWNSSFVPGADWDARDRFSQVCTTLFEALVLAPAGIQGARLPQMSRLDDEPIAALQVVPRDASGLPVFINRSTPRCGYWDDPVDRVGTDARLVLVNFFDFDELGRRDFEYLEVEILDFPAQPHLVGRRALFRFEYARILAPAPDPGCPST